MFGGNGVGKPRKAKPVKIKERKPRDPGKDLLFNLVWNSAFGGFAVTSAIGYLGDGRYGWALFQFSFFLLFAALTWMNINRFIDQEYGSRIIHNLEYEIAELERMGYRVDVKAMTIEDTKLNIQESKAE